MKPVFSLLLLLACCLDAHAAVGEWRTLQDGEGGVIKARFEGLKDDHLLLRRQNDGKLFEVPAGMLTGEDRTSFEAQAKQLSEELEKLSKMAGHPLFSGTPFEVRKAEEIARALELNRESKTLHSASWRAYTGDSYKLFGARPYSVALYADEAGNATVLSAVYSNKGDFKSGVGQGESQSQWLPAALGADSVALYMAAGASQSIAAALIGGGKPASTPVALVESASLPEEARIFTTLGALAAAPLPRASGPVVMFVGAVFADAVELERELASERYRAG